jgi:hypothetical protein
MTKPLALGTLLGGLALFLWGALYHAALPFYTSSMQSFTNEDAVAQAVLAGAPRAGTYAVPHMPANATGEQRQAVEERAQRGPLVLAFVRPGPFGSMGTYLGRQLAIDLAVGLVATLILLLARPAGYGARVLLLVVVGLAVWLATGAPHWNWYASGAAYAMAELGEHLGGWALAGLVLARVAAQREPR